MKDLVGAELLYAASRFKLVHTVLLRESIKDLEEVIDRVLQGSPRDLR